MAEETDSLYEACIYAFTDAIWLNLYIRLRKTRSSVNATTLLPLEPQLLLKQTG